MPDATRLPTTAAVTKALEAADFPATKDQLVGAAQAASADEAVLSALRSLPLAEYSNRSEVLRSVETVEATGASKAQHAAQAPRPHPGSPSTSGTSTTEAEPRGPPYAGIHPL